MAKFTVVGIHRRDLLGGDPTVIAVMGGVPEIEYLLLGDGWADVIEAADPIEAAIQATARVGAQVQLWEKRERQWEKRERQ